jgi:hypothetical protein
MTPLAIEMDLQTLYNMHIVGIISQCRPTSMFGRHLKIFNLQGRYAGTINRPTLMFNESCLSKFLNFSFFSGFFSGLFFEKHLKYIKLSEEYVAFTKLNLTYLLKVSTHSHVTVCIT